MVRLTPHVTRRTFTLSLLIAPMACLGCGGERQVEVAEKAGEKRRQRVENLQKRTEMKGKPEGKKAP